VRPWAEGTHERHRALGASSTTLALGSALILLANSGVATAFPFVDPTNQDTIPSGAPLGTELPAEDVTGLRNQLRLTNPASPGNPGPWTILPRLTLQEEFTDNALEVTGPRRFDAATVVAPGITVLADTSRLKLSLDYQPDLILHAIDAPLNVVTQQLTAIGLVTVVPDFAYVDVRAVSGVQSPLGAVGGTGTLGASDTGLDAPASNGVTAYNTGQGLNRLNEVQTSSYGIAPYLLREFGDYGTGKVGVSANAARSSTISGFVASPFPTGGTNGQTTVTTEETARFTSGQFLARLQDTVDIDLQQSRSQADSIAATVANTNTTTTVPGSSLTSQRQTFNNQLSYALDHAFTLVASAGEQSITYSTPNFPNVHGPIWNVGLIYAPGPDTSIKITYGHLNGANSVTANGYFAVGGRSLATFSYSDTIGTQLENLQDQLNNSSIGQTGALISSQTGGPALVATNASPVQAGVFRFKTATASFLTRWPRDTLQATMSWSQQTSLTPSLALSSITIDPVTGTAILNTTPATTSGPSTTVSTAGLSWAHELSPDMTMTSGATYSYIQRSGNINDESVAVAIGLRYIVSPSTLLSVRYSFFDRISKIPGYSLYENILLLGVTKQF
jgi:uncharacterized protein (PEP-CTERM system associated)